MSESGRRGRYIFVILMLSVLAFTIVPMLLTLALPRDDVAPEYSELNYAVKLETTLRDTFLSQDFLRLISNQIDTISGKRELVSTYSDFTSRQNGIFVGKNSLMKNVDPPIAGYISENISGITEFSDILRQYRIPTYFMLIPTSSAIKQAELPDFAQSVMVNQRAFIDDVYIKVSDSVVTIDAYMPLISNQNEYIYYRTENNLTSLGGFLIYRAMVSRLGLGKVDLRQFDISYLTNNYYGNLCKESGYYGVEPDTVAHYIFNRARKTPREYLVTHTTDAGTKTYHTLYPTFAAENSGALDTFLGGLSTVTTIKNSAVPAQKLLVFGDNTAISYLPMLANNASEITFVDLFGSSQIISEISQINPINYDKVMFAYGVESFMHTNNPSRATNLIEE